MIRADHAPYFVTPASFEPDFTDGHLMRLFESFAQQVDNRLQTRLTRELMNRYAAVSASLEEKNRRLAVTDARRREAQTIAKLADWNVSLPSGRLYWSETMFTILDIPPTDHPTLDQLLDKIDPQDRPMVEQRAQMLFAGQDIGSLTYRFQMPDGRVKWVLANHVVDRAPDGTLLSVHGTLQDITTAKLAEETLQRYNQQLENTVNEKIKEINESHLTTIYALVKLAESRDDDTGDHIKRTSSYCRLLASHLREDGYHLDQIDETFIENIALASPLHDIGKVGIPDQILLKPGKLTPEEFAVMKTHVTIGYNTLASVEKMYPGNAFLRMGMEITRYHHERWDGTGYQDGLAGEEIPLAARMMAISDVYDALRSRRVYKEPFSHEHSMELMVQGRGKHFDPLLVDEFAAHHEEYRAVFDNSEKA